MKTIYACSDIHDDTQALEAFAKYATAQGADHIACLGDLALRPYSAEALKQLALTKNLSTFLAARETQTNQNLLEMKTILDSSGIDYSVIPGNYDKKLDTIFGSRDLHGKTRQLGSAKVFGYGGADAYPDHIALLVQIGQHTDREEIVNFSHEELYGRLSVEQPAIGLIHNPPHQLCDDLFNGQHVGTKATTQHILEYGPKLIMSGHIHEAGPNGNNPNGVRGIAGYQNPKTGKTTVVINPGNLGRFELINPTTLEPIRAFDYGTFVRVDVEEDGTPKKLVQYSLQTKDRGVGQIRTLDEITL